MPVPLTPSAIALLGLAAWSLLLVLLLINQRGLLVLSGRMRVNAFAPDGSNTPSEFGQRLVRAHANCVENLPLLAAVLLYAIASGQTALTDPLACVLLGARLFQSVMHLISTSALFVWLRFAGFLVQLLILAWWLLSLSGLL
ncbi:MAPEG family protein [Pseudomonas sp. J452]|uniref:MAPEG family protein n=1 Tax=Pseudomonas sp. J452 TaxID=2898441 RepID=UPI0021AE2CBD|nr:MAPEG family protein [Pseudomonas sp. J452]UUY10204.1 MAPEG family protein [Pseudomonas sp. J452]